MDGESDQKIDALVSKILRIPLAGLSNEMTPHDTEHWDSLTHLTLIAALEEEFAIDIEPEEIIEMYKGYGILKSIVLQKMAKSITK